MIFAVPIEAISEAGMEAVNCMLLIKVVVRSALFQRIMEPATKLFPFTVRVKDDPPTKAEAGLRFVVPGTGFG